MVGVSYELVDFRTGGPILDLPVREGASWASQLNRADALSCSVNLRDPAALALDLRAASEPKKTVLRARDDDGNTLAWGLIDDDRVWDEDSQTVELNATGIWSSLFGDAIIGPASALTTWLTDDEGVPNPALNTYAGGYSLGTIGKKIVQQRLTWPGSPTMSLPADQIGDHEENYDFVSFKRVGAALTDLTNRENGPDFAFDAARSSGGLTLVYSMRHGSESSPGIGIDVGSWSLGGDTPITGLKVTDSSSDVATAAWGSAGRGARFVHTAGCDLLAKGFPLSVVQRARRRARALARSLPRRRLRDARRPVGSQMAYGRYRDLHNVDLRRRDRQVY